MKTRLTLLLTLFWTATIYAQWSPAGNKIKTQWGVQIDVNNVLPEGNAGGLFEFAANVCSIMI